jgi:hypothetical protein
LLFSALRAILFTVMLIKAALEERSSNDTKAD